MTITLQAREHVNIMGTVPTINEVARLALKLRARPRIVESAIDGAVNLHFATAAKSHEKTLLHEFIGTGWSFVHTKIGRPGEQALFVILATIADEHDEQKRIADHIDGYDRDDLGESPDY
jgi:hypothetical protein